MKILTLFCLLTSTESQLYDDDWPVDIEGVTELFKVIKYDRMEDILTFLSRLNIVLR